MKLEDLLMDQSDVRNWTSLLAFAVYTCGMEVEDTPNVYILEVDKIDFSSFLEKCRDGRINMALANTPTKIYCKVTEEVENELHTVS